MKTHLILFLLFFIWTSCGNSTKPSASTSTDDDFEVLEERLPIADPYVLFTRIAIMHMEQMSGDSKFILLPI